MKPKMPLEVLIQHAEGPQTGLRGFFGFMRDDRYTGRDMFDALEFWGPKTQNPAVQRWWKQYTELHRDLAANYEKRQKQDL